MNTPTQHPFFEPTLLRRMAGAVTLWLAALILTACGNSGTSTATTVIQSGSPSNLTTQLASIAIGPPDTNLPRGLVHQYTATGIYADGSKLDLTTSVVWTSSNAPVG